MSDPGPSSFSYGIDPEVGLVLAKMRGVLSGEEMLGILETVHDDPDWEDGTDAIWDCSDVVTHDVSPPEVHPIVLEAAAGGRGTDVLVLDGSLSDRVVSEMLAFFSRRLGKTALVRTSLGEALEALGRDALPEGLRSVGVA